MDTQKILIALLGLLIVVAAFQFWQISKQGGKATGQATAASSSDAAYARVVQEQQGSGASAQKQPPGSPLDNAPNMVGGC